MGFIRQTSTSLVTRRRTRVFTSNGPHSVIPAKAGIQSKHKSCSKGLATLGALLYQSHLPGSFPFLESLFPGNGRLSISPCGRPFLDSRLRGNDVVGFIGRARKLFRYAFAGRTQNLTGAVHPRKLFSNAQNNQLAGSLVNRYRITVA